MVTTAPSRKLLERCGKALGEAGLLPPAQQPSHNSSLLPEIVRALIVTTSASQSEPLNDGQIRAWAASLSDLTSDRALAVEALRLGILPALPRFLQRYTNNNKADASWSDALIALHDFALLEDRGFPEALEKLDSSDLSVIATNISKALRLGLHPAEARDAASRLAIYDPMMPHLIDAGVLPALIQFIPSVKPLSRITNWGAEALRQINNSLNAMDLLLFIYTKMDREQELPIKDLASAQLTGWVCDVLHGSPGGDSKIKDEVEASKISALDCLTSLLINATVCRLAVPNNRSMLFRVASAITCTSSIALLSAAAQVLAQALSEEDLVQPSELASLHTYDLVRHLSQVLEESRDFKALLNVLAALQNILDPAHFKGSVPSMKKVAERLVACSFEDQLAEFMNNPKAYFDMPKASDPACPTPEDLEALEDAGKGALENTRTLLAAAGPVSVTVLPRSKGGRPAAGGTRKGAQNVPASVIAELTRVSGETAKGKRKAVDEASGEVTRRKRSDSELPLADRVQLEKEMRKAASLAAPLLSGPPLRSVLDWFNEWGPCRQRLEDELGTDVHVEGSGHRVLLQEAVTHSDPWACLDLLSDILQVRLPPLKHGVQRPVGKPEPEAKGQAQTRGQAEVTVGSRHAAQAEVVAAPTMTVQQDTVAASSSAPAAAAEREVLPQASIAEPASVKPEAAVAPQVDLVPEPERRMEEERMQPGGETVQQEEALAPQDGVVGMQL